MQGQCVSLPSFYAHGHPAEICQLRLTGKEEWKMANENKKLVEAITSMEEDFAQWYTDVVKKAELCDYSSVKGCMIIKPAGYAIWEQIQQQLDAAFKKTGGGECIHANVHTGESA